MRRLNIDGDGQGDLAGHGGEHRAVFVYQIESYRYWQEQLGRDDFEYGQFGENFTVSGLADDQVCIGDRYRIGEALFEVTQPRVTCYRVGIRMDEPRMPSLLVSHHRPGFYFRVLREGAVRAGDEIVQVAAGPEAMTVAEVDALLYLPGHSRERVLTRAAHPGAARRLEGLVPGHAGQAEAPGGAAGNAGLTAVSPPPAWPGFRPLAVTAVNRESDSVIVGVPGRSRRDRPAAAPARAVPDPAAERRSRRAAAAAQLLAVRRAGRRLLPHQRQARAARRRAASSCTTGSGPATCWRRPRRAARSSSSRGTRRSC